MNEDLFAELVTSVREGGAILRGDVAPSRQFVVEPLDVKNIREGYSLSQEQFATLLGISVKTLQNWEQGHRVARPPRATWPCARAVAGRRAASRGRVGRCAPAIAR